MYFILLGIKENSLGIPQRQCALVEETTPPLTGAKCAPEPRLREEHSGELFRLAICQLRASHLHQRTLGWPVTKAPL